MTDSAASSLEIVSKNSNESSVCPICGSHSSKRWSLRSWALAFSGREFVLRKCRDCTSLFAWPRPAGSEIEDYYAHCFDYGWYERHRALKRIQAWHRWQRVKKLLHLQNAMKGRILDVGCGHGHFLHFAQQSGWDAVGLDYPSQALAYASSHYGLSTLAGDASSVLSENDEHQAAYDLVTAWHCLEHATDPLAMMRALAAFLQPEGNLWVAVPNAVCPGMKRRGEDWIWCQEPYVHTVHLSPAGMVALARRAGLAAVRLWSRETWDANYLFDADLERPVGRLMEGLAALSPRAGFWAYEGLRIGCYALGSAGHWLMGRELEPSAGSELLMLAARPKPGEPATGVVGELQTEGIAD